MLATTVVAGRKRTPDGNIAGVQVLRQRSLDRLCRCLSVPHDVHAHGLPGLYVLTVARATAETSRPAGVCSVQFVAPLRLRRDLLSFFRLHRRSRSSRTGSRLLLPPSGFVTSVKFFVNGVPLASKTSFPIRPIGFRPPPVPTRSPPGSRQCREYSDSTAPVAVTVGTSTPPTVLLTNPLDLVRRHGQSFHFNITANAADQDGTISHGGVHR